MLEIRQVMRRSGALAASAATGLATVAVRPLPCATRYALRVAPRAGDAAFLDLAVNRLWTDRAPPAGPATGPAHGRASPWGPGTGSDRFSARLGPDEWLIGGEEDDGDRLRQDIERALEGRFHALIDISHRNVGVEVSGPLAAAALNAGCPLDLSDAAFPAGTATRTLLGKAEIVLMRAGDAPVFRVECWRSFSPYVFAFLAEAARTSS